MPSRPGPNLRRWLPEVIARQGGLCAHCGTPLPQAITPAIHADHRIPVSKGGESTLENTDALHAFCNKQKAARLVPEPVGRACHTPGCKRAVVGQAMFCALCKRERARVAKQNQRRRDRGEPGAPPRHPGRVAKAPGADDQRDLYGSTPRKRRTKGRAARDRATAHRVTELLRLNPHLDDSDLPTLRELAETENRRQTLEDAGLRNPAAPDTPLMRLVDGCSRHILALHSALGITPTSRGRAHPGHGLADPLATPVDVEPDIYDAGAFQPPESTH